MSRVISVALAKGGVGKTTTSVNLAAGLASRDKRVLLIDTDTQNQSSHALGMNPERGLYDLIIMDEGVGDVMVTARPNLYLIGGGDDIARLIRDFGRADYKVEYQMKNKLDYLRDYFDYIVLDGKPGWDLLAINILFFADEIVCPVPPEGAAIAGLGNYLRRNEKMRVDSGVELRYVLPTMVDYRLSQTNEIMESINSMFADVVCDPIRRNVRLSEAYTHGQTIFEYAPKSQGAKDYNKFVERVLADE